MPLSWNEIKQRAIAFSKEWESETSEKSESQSFWNDFFNVFGISRRRVGSFELPIKKADNKQGFIDLLWKGMILVEHKSRGKDLDKATQQAKDYFPNLKEHELPKYILVSDFQKFRLYDLDTNETKEFELQDFVNHVHLFGFIAGYEKRVYKDEAPVNIKAAELMGKLHDRLKEIGYIGHDLEVYLVRLLFCMFADYTGIFNKGIFWEYIDLHTKEDGSDLAMHIASIFHILNTPNEKRLKNLDENLAQFPYVNGKLFEETVQPAAFDKQMREILLKACAFDWGKISPAIFGSMFQAVMNQTERRNLGAHYTSEKNIQKLIKPLFLDDLYIEFEKAKGSKGKLEALHKKIANLHFLDPACGCGNFLIITYRELRDLELEILKELYRKHKSFLDVGLFIKVDVDQFAGIEYDEFAVRVAEVAMWLIDHQMNVKVSNEFGQYFVRLPLKKAAKIVHGNSLRIDWESIVVKEKLNFILGNPPFVGSKMMNETQRDDLLGIFNDAKGAGVMDYVSAWYVKAAELIQNSNIQVAFVSTSSISQGEQVGILWNILFNKYKIKIHFAHRTFKWANEARKNAAVDCVIIGFANFDILEKRIFEYEDIKGEPLEIKAKNINPYLVNGTDTTIQRRRKPLSNIPSIGIGNKPIDGGNYLFTTPEKGEFIKIEPKSAKWFRKWVGSDEFINNRERWCLWLGDCPPNELKQMPQALKRVEAVKKVRLESKSIPTQKLAQTPTRFHVENMPSTDYLLVPSVSSENRNYIPLGFIPKEVITSNLCLIISEATLYHFGVLTSEMHMTWVKYVCGRLKSDYRYSKDIVYNNYPFPENVSDKQKQKVETAAQTVLDTRAKYPDSSLADLYDPLTMPPDLVKAHKALDKAVDLCYRPQPFVSELNRIEYLFSLYEALSTPLLKVEKKKRSKKKDS
ncbi:class I SAM-dependent DNA methyltransferase [Nodularia spumigena CS-591/12]|uniref:class I SAM-dependent DNA methyltransferase n=3 Tax=Nodularia spumigena TaxID=70799 RepID=UPI00232B4356|nr:DNA methyltransferase [Nodularia spumigena]MDB9303276.1 class I SAM-dependent DNA methyltransferase [Nodularia spumigena CS-591/12]MDB9320824.1 class I SAM-dependent DNA methyltransferase [Nodularia spumigena CS-591/07A]MDB9362801.1 class I SAM-dependent DNA methyltransferase [Nodularia spumigena CS-588/02]MDB9364612.1 class I SAM-dependent DNA methyltransferase [Nodularia spumigena CS-588/02A10]